MVSARSMTAANPSSNDTAREAISALYSPRLCPMSIETGIPAASRTANIAREAVTMAGCMTVGMVRRSSLPEPTVVERRSPYRSLYRSSARAMTCRASGKPDRQPWNMPMLWLP